jgi:hypothetical protein
MITIYTDCGKIEITDPDQKKKKTDLLGELSGLIGSNEIMSVKFGGDTLIIKPSSIAAILVTEDKE